MPVTIVSPTSHQAVPSMTSEFGIALGGGGAVGLAWEVGVLAGLAEAAALEANRARVIVGTSAGAIIGALVRRGKAPRELIQRLELLTPAPPEPDMQAVRAVFALMARQGTPTEERIRKTADIALSAQTQPIEPFIATIAQCLGDGWPAGDLRVTAVDCDSCQLKVWTAADGIGLARAVTSSGAVPGVIGPVPANGRRYMDGGVLSPSNVDLLAGSGVQRAILIGPLAGPAAAKPHANAVIETERARLAAEGIPLLVIGPGDGFRPLAAELMNTTHQQAAVEVGLADGREAADGLRSFVGRD